MNILSRINEHAASSPSKTAIFTNGEAISYERLIRQVAGIVRLIQNHGVSNGHKVVITTPWPQSHFFAALLALFRMGVTVAVLPSEFVSRNENLLCEMNFVAQLIPPEQQPVSIVQKRKLRQVWLSSIEVSNASDYIDEICASDFLAQLVFNNSAGDISKIIPISDARLNGEILQHKKNEYLNQTSRVASFFGVYTSPWIKSALRTLVSGGTVCSISQSVGGGYLEQIKAQEITHLHSPISVMSRILSSAPQANIIETLERLDLYGLNCPQGLYEACRKHFHGEFTQSWGCVEVGQIASRPLDEESIKNNGVGYLLSGVEATIVGHDNNEVESGKTGRLRIKTQHMARGYIGNPIETARHFKEGWFYPGNHACVDDVGFIKISDSAEEMMVYDFQKIDFLEIDRLAKAYPGILDAALFSHPNADGQHEPWVAVVGPQFLNLDGFFKLASESGCDLMGAYFVERIPRINGKVDRVELTDSFSRSGLLQR